MSAILPSGMRAVAISIDTRGATSAGGFILPNDRVDVIHTVQAASESGANPAISEIILTNIRVLAIGQNVQERNGEKVVTGETATLELTPAQAEKVVLAQKVGQLSLALRSIADVNETGTPAREERNCAPGDPLRRPTAGTRTMIRTIFRTGTVASSIVVAGALAAPGSRSSPTDCAAPPSDGPVLAIGSEAADIRAQGRPLDRPLAHRRSAARREGGLRRQSQGRQRRRALDAQGLRDRHRQRRHVDLRDGCRRAGRSRRSK